MQFASYRQRRYFDLHRALRIDGLEAKCQAGKTPIQFLSGAVGGIDALTSAHAHSGSPAEKSYDLANLKTLIEHFSGTAQDAAKLYPKNANIDATYRIALASIGLDHVYLNIGKNIHEIEVTGFPEMECSGGRQQILRRLHWLR